MLILAVCVSHLFGKLKPSTFYASHWHSQGMNITILILICTMQFRIEIKKSMLHAFNVYVCWQSITLHTLV